MVKLPAWLKIALAVVIACAAGLAMWGRAEHRAYLKAVGASAVLTAEYRDYKAQSEPIIKHLQAEAITLRADKNAAIDRALAADALKVKAIKERDAALASVAAMPADTLSGSINLRIGAGQSYPTAGCLFTFTRPGTEATLRRFIEGESYRVQYEAETTSTANLRSALDSAERENGNLGLRLTISDKTLAKAVAAWDAEHSARVHLERSRFGMQIKYAVYGAGTVVVIEKVIIPLLKTLGVIK